MRLKTSWTNLDCCVLKRPGRWIEEALYGLLLEVGRVHDAVWRGRCKEVVSTIINKPSYKLLIIHAYITRNVLLTRLLHSGVLVVFRRQKSALP